MRAQRTRLDCLSCRTNDVSQVLNLKARVIRSCMVSQLPLWSSRQTVKCPLVNIWHGEIVIMMSSVFVCRYWYCLSLCSSMVISTTVSVSLDCIKRANVASMSDLELTNHPCMLYEQSKRITCPVAPNFALLRISTYFVWVSLPNKIRKLIQHCAFVHLLFVCWGCVGGGVCLFVFERRNLAI